MQLPISHLQPSVAVDFPAFDSRPATDSANTWGGLSVAVLPTITAFFSSLSPRYQTQQLSSEVVTPDNAAEPGSWKAGDIASKVKLACNMLACWVPSVGVVNEAVAAICSTLSLAQELDDVLEGKKEQHAPRPINLNGPAAAALALVALDSLAPAAAVPAPGMPGSRQNPIPVPDGVTLGKIGQAGYPTDAYYIQNQSFSHNIREPGPDFNGHYDGGCHSISGLKNCLFSTIERHGEVHNLRLVNIDINDTRHATGGLACIMAPYSTARNIQVAHARVSNQAAGNDTNPAATGIIVGHQQEGAFIRAVNLHNGSVLTHSEYSATGVVGGLIDGRLQDANITDCQAESLSKDSPTGIGAGRLRGSIERMAVDSSKVTTGQMRSYAGIGAGHVQHGSIQEFGAGRCQVFADGPLTPAGIGAGKAVGELKQMTMAKCQVKTSQRKGFAGIGAGQLGVRSSGEHGHLDTLFAVASSVTTGGDDASAGVGVGRLNIFSRADRMTLFNCTVISSGDGVLTGIGAGFNGGQINNLTTVHSEARNSDDTAGLEAGDGGMTEGTASLNSRVNNELQTRNPPSLPGLCSNADPRFVTRDCAPVPYADAPPVCLSTVPQCGSSRLPIAIYNEAAFNSIGRSSNFPADAYYIQTNDLDGSRLDSNALLVFNGHYDGRNRVIRDQHACLFRNLNGTLKNLQLTNAHIIADGRPAAVGACTMSGDSLIKNLRITDSQVSNHHPTETGIVSGQRVGRHNQVTGIVVHNATVETHADEAHAGVIAGLCEGKTSMVNIHRSRVITHGNKTSAGLGCGLLRSGSLELFDATCSHVETMGRESRTGIVAGSVDQGLLSQMTLVNNSIITHGDDSDAGGGAGYLDGRLIYFNALDTRVHARGDRSSAGTGVGHLFRGGVVEDITSVNGATVTEGIRTYAGVCTGSISRASSYLILNPRSVNNTVQVRGQGSQASVHGWLPNNTLALADNAITVNTRVNHSLVDDGPIQRNISENFCAYARPALVLADCRVNQVNLPGNCARPTYPPAPVRSALPATCSPVPWSAPTDIPTLPAGTVSLSSRQPLAPTNVSTRPAGTVSLPSRQPLTPTNVSALPAGTVSLQPLAITAAVPLTSGLSIAAMSGIAVACTTGLIAACVVAACCYRHYHHRPPKPNNDLDMNALL